MEIQEVMEKSIEGGWRPEGEVFGKKVITKNTTPISIFGKVKITNPLYTYE